MKILITGDSWEANWNVKHKTYTGWPNILADYFDITNIAQAGVSQYKICKQIDSVNLDDYDFIIFGITSPYRIYTPNHPVHKQDKLHSNSDLIFTDIEYHLSQNPTDDLKSIMNFYHNHFDVEYAEFIHKLLINWALSKLDKNKTIISSNIENNKNFIENITVQSKFNRLVLFDSSQFHAAKKFIEKDMEEDRLTLFGLFYSLSSKDIKYPCVENKRIL